MPNTTIFFAADVHGSEACFKKFLSAAKVYKADVLILNGDLTGKVIVPVVQQNDGSFEANFLDRKWTTKTDQQLQDLEKTIRHSGYYPYRTTPDGFESLKTDKEKLDRMFLTLMVETMKLWSSIAEERLKETNATCYVNPGNDDPPETGDVIKGEHIINPEGQVIQLDSVHEMITSGHSNITPWNAPRDIPDEDFAKEIEGMASQVKEMNNCIFNFHCPPFDSGLDIAPRLDATLKPVMRAGGMDMIPVGSKSVRNAIMKHQPLLGLHGHIHESRGVVRLGRTLCINPGSEYAEGILRGALVTLDEKGVKKYQLTQG